MTGHPNDNVVKWIVFALVVAAFLALLFTSGRVSLPQSTVLAAWVQAVGSVGAILLAVLLWRADRKSTAQDQAHQRTEQIRRMVLGLRAEIRCALDAAEGWMESVRTVGQDRQRAEAAGRQIKDEPLDPASVRVTDAVIYRTCAQDLGVMPSAIVEDIVGFYETAAEIHRLVAIKTTSSSVLGIMDRTMPRLRMLGELLVLKLVKFEQNGFDPNIPITYSKAEGEALAKKTGWQRGRNP